MSKIKLTDDEARRGVESFNRHLATGKGWDEAFKAAVEDVLDEGTEDVVDPRQLPLFGDADG